MNAAVLFPVPMHAVPGYSWQWRSVGNKVKSTERFIYYYDCLADARLKRVLPANAKSGGQREISGVRRTEAARRPLVSHPL